MIVLTYMTGYLVTFFIGVYLQVKDGCEKYRDSTSRVMNNQSETEALLVVAVLASLFMAIISIVWPVVAVVYLIVKVVQREGK